LISITGEEAPVEMVEENELKKTDDKEKKTTTQKVVSGETSYDKLYKDMLNEDLLTEDANLEEAAASARTVLDGSNFEETVKHGYTFVKFYAPWCGHCQQMAPEWNDLANDLFKKPISGVDLTIAEVDCVDAPMTCSDEGVEGYPSIKLYKDGNIMEDYYYARTAERMKRFLYEKLVDISELEPNTIGLYTLNDFTFTKFIESSGSTPVLVKFYVPWCQHCKNLQEVYDELVIKFLMEESEDLKFAEVNCMDMDSLDTCTEEGVDGFPSVYMYKDGQLEDLFDGERTVDGLSNFVWQTVDPSRVEAASAMDEYLNLASMMGGMGGGAEEDAEDEYEECDCSDPDCECDEEDEDVEYYDEDETSDDVDYDDNEYDDETEEDEVGEEGHDKEDVIKQKSEENLETKSAEKTESKDEGDKKTENTLEDKQSESKKDEL